MAISAPMMITVMTMAKPGHHAGRVRRMRLARVGREVSMIIGADPRTAFDIGHVRRLSLGRQPHTLTGRRRRTDPRSEAYAVVSARRGGEAVMMSEWDTIKRSKAYQDGREEMRAEVDWHVQYRKDVADHIDRF